MIILRQKEFVALEAGAKVARNIWYRTGKLLQPILKKSDKEIAASAIRAGRKANRVIRQPIAVGSNILVKFVSRPLETLGMPLLVAPELISTAVGGGMIAAGKGLRKIKPIGRASERVAKFLKNQNIYKRAQSSTRGFHNNFKLPEYVTYGGIGALGTASVLAGRKRYLKKHSKLEAEPTTNLAPV